MEKKLHQFGGASMPDILAHKHIRNGHGGGNDGGSGMEKRLGLLEKAFTEMKETFIAMASKTDAMEKHSATKTDLAVTELNLIKWYVATAFAMTGLACAITFGLTRLLATG